MNFLVIKKIRQYIMIERKEFTTNHHFEIWNVQLQSDPKVQYD